MGARHLAPTVSQSGQANAGRVATVYWVRLGRFGSSDYETSKSFASPPFKPELGLGTNSRLLANQWYTGSLTPQSQSVAFRDMVPRQNQLLG